MRKAKNAIEKINDCAEKLDVDIEFDYQDRENVYILVSADNYPYNFFIEDSSEVIESKFLKTIEKKLTMY